jgi:hypothetical protein
MSRLPKYLLTPRAAGLIGVLAFLVLGFGLFGSTGHDDSHITYWVAYSLEALGKLANYNGDRVEQSSSLAHVLILAALGKLTHVPYPTLGPITSIVGAVATILLVVKLAQIALPEGAPRGVVILAATGESFVYWGFGGLETTIVSAAAVWVVYTAARHLERPSPARLAHAALAMLLYVTARPESPLVLGCMLAAALAHTLLRRRRFPDPARSLGTDLTPVVALCAVAAVEASALFAFRKAYFGLWFPNPVYAKVPGLAYVDGLTYIGVSLFPAGLWVLPGLYYGVRGTVRSALRERVPASAAFLASAFVVAYLAFVVLVGGDWMSGGRFFAHIFPLIAVITTIGVVHRIRGERWAQRTMAILVGLNLAGILLLVFFPFARVSNGRPLWSTPGIRQQLDAKFGDRHLSWFETTNVVHLRDAPVTAVMLDLVRAVREMKLDRKIVLFSSQAGMVTYHVFRENPDALRYVDICSLATRDFLACPAAQTLVDGSRFGMLMRYETYFGNQKRLDPSCGTTRPDIIFGLNVHSDLPVLKENGYTIFFEQKGAVRGTLGKGSRSADAFKSDQYVAIDTALYENLGLKKKDRYQWDIR